MPTTTADAAEIENDEHDVADQARTSRSATLDAVIDAADDGEIEAALANVRPERQTKEEIVAKGLASAHNRVAVLAAIGQALPDLGDKQVVINVHGGCALPVAVDIDGVTAADRSSGPAGRRWLLAVVDADEDAHVIKQKYPARTLILAVSRKPIGLDVTAAVACN